MRASYKNWSLYALVDAKLGGQIYCASYVVAMQTGQSLETLYEREGNGLPYYENGEFLGNYGIILPGYCINTETGEAVENDHVVHYLYKYMRARTTARATPGSCAASSRSLTKASAPSRSGSPRSARSSPTSNRSIPRNGTFRHITTEIANGTVVIATVDVKHAHMEFSKRVGDTERNHIRG